MGGGFDIFQTARRIGSKRPPCDVVVVVVDDDDVDAPGLGVCGLRVPFLRQIKKRFTLFIKDGDSFNQVGMCICYRETYCPSIAVRGGGSKGASLYPFSSSL